MPGILARVPNPNGHADTLTPAPLDNTRAVKHGLYSRSGRVLAPRADEIADALMQLPHVAGLDCLAAEEAASLIAQLEAIDRELTERGPYGPGRKSLLENKARLGRELRAWLREFGGTPRSRFEFAARMSGPRLADKIKAALAEIDDERAD